MTNILIVYSNGVSDLRMDFAARGLKRAGYEVDMIREVPFYKSALYDVFIIQRPGLPMLRFVECCLEAGKPVIIDMDDDFTSIPAHSPAYKIVGPGAPDRYLRKLQDTISRATVLTVTNPVVAERYHRPNAVIVPNCFDEDNLLWQLPRRKTDYTTIGWSGTDTHHMDFNLAARPVKNILRERPDVQVAIGNDIGIFRLFDDMPPEQVLFLPGLSYELYPLMWSFWDVVIAPLVDDRFNQAKSDIKLVEAGARGIPWVASPVKPYTEWGVGGLYAGTEQEWEDALIQVLQRDELYGLREAGMHKSRQERTAFVIGSQWQEIVGGLL